MKKYLFLLLAACFLGFSCSKDHSGNPETKSYKLTYKISDFSSADTAFQKTNQVTLGVKTTTAVAPSSIMDVLYCSIYDSSGKSINTIKQLSTDAGFGTITTNLPAGNYTLVFAGGKTGLFITAFSQDKGTLNTDMLTYDGDIKDTYYKKVSITVNSDNTQSITLNRIVAQLNLVIQDAIPPASSAYFVNFFIIKKTPFYDAFQVNGGNLRIHSSDGWVDTVPATKLGTSNYSIKKLIFTNSTSFQLEITAYQNVPSSITSRWIANTMFLNLTAVVNQTTVASTRLFDHVGDPSLPPVLTH